MTLMKISSFLLAAALLAAPPHLYGSQKSVGSEAAFSEPSAPVTDHPFSFEKEAKVNEIAGLDQGKALRRLQEVEFLADDPLLARAISERFRQNRKEALDWALGLLHSPVTEMVEGTLVDKSRSFHVARKIMQVFPEESWKQLATAYSRGDSVVKGNIILLSGRIAAGPQIKEMLTSALDDKQFYGEKNPVMDGDPMRICDLAYNQLVLRYEIENMLRSIGTVHAIEDRDEHIGKLKLVLKNGPSAPPAPERKNVE
jgi:hypothetical protein